MYFVFVRFVFIAILDPSLVIVKLVAILSHQAKEAVITSVPSLRPVTVIEPPVAALILTPSPLTVGVFVGLPSQQSLLRPLI